MQIISKFKQQLIWEKIIISWLQKQILQDPENFKISYTWLNSNSWKLAIQASAAWNTLQAWDLSLESIDFDTLEVKSLLTWITKYQLICIQYGYIEQFSDPYQTVWLQTQTLTASNNILTASKYQIALSNLRQELSYATKWSANLMATNPDNKIGIIILNSELNYGQIEYTCSNHLNLTQYQIAIGQTLDNCQFINFCLLILQFTNTYLQTNQYILYEDFSKLLISPFVAGAQQEATARFYLDYILRKEVDYKFNGNYLRKTLQKFKKKSTIYTIPIFLKIYNKFEKKIKQLIQDLDLINHPPKKNSKQWLKIINGILTIFGWGKENFKLLPSKFYLNWQALVDCYLEQTELLEEHEFNHGLKIINRIAATTSTTENNHNICNTEKKIIITNLTTAVNNNYHEFDYLWLCGTNMVNLSNNINYNPLLPKQIYRKIINKIGASIEDLYVIYLKNLINTTKNQIITSYSNSLETVPVVADDLIKDFIKIDPENIVDFTITNNLQILENYISNKFPNDLQILENFTNNKIINNPQILKNHISINTTNNPQTLENPINTKLSNNLQNFKNPINTKITNNQQILENYVSIKIPNSPIKNSVIPLEKFTDNNTIAYSSNDFSGTNWIKLQTACPFKANAKIRLGAVGLEQPKKYITKLDKGQIIHKILADFWKKHQGLSKVKELDPSQIYQELDYLSNKHLSQLQQSKPNSLPTQLLHLEQTRISNICYKFINNYELTRSEFNALHLEKKFIVKLKDFSIKIKVDRVDELANKDLIIIDYKTGKMTNNYFCKINNSIPDDPQLIIYSLISPKIQGLILAHLRNYDSGVQGILSDEKFFPEISQQPTKQVAKFHYPQNFNQYLDEILTNLYDIATDFKQGIAVVKPKAGQQTCNQCDLHSFCRIKREKL